jgi:hypothetical protein
MRSDLALFLRLIYTSDKISPILQFVTSFLNFKLSQEAISTSQLPVFAAKWQHEPWKRFAPLNLVKNHKTVNNSATSEAKEKNVQDLKSLEF